MGEGVRLEEEVPFLCWERSYDQIDVASHYPFCDVYIEVACKFMLKALGYDCSIFVEPNKEKQKAFHRSIDPPPVHLRALILKDKPI